MTANTLNWDGVDAALFDLDGVITPTAEVHKRAWSSMFNDFLGQRGDDEPFTEDDYYAYVDGKPRADGIKSFLASRGIDLPEGNPDDPASADTIDGLGTRKNEMFTKILKEEGISAYPGSIKLIDYLTTRGVRQAIVSSSRNAKAVLATAGLLDRFDVIVDGVIAADRGLAGKPAPDSFSYAADELGVPHDHAVVFEDALSGVQAGRAGNFLHVVGVDRGAGAQALAEHGADIVVTDLAQLIPNSS